MACPKHDLKHRQTRKYVVQYQCFQCKRLFHFDKFAVRLMVSGAVSWNPDIEVKSSIRPQTLQAI